MVTLGQEHLIDIYNNNYLLVITLFLLCSGLYTFYLLTLNTKHKTPILFGYKRIILIYFYKVYKGEVSYKQFFYTLFLIAILLSFLLLYILLVGLLRQHVFTAFDISVSLNKLFTCLFAIIYL